MEMYLQTGKHWGGSKRSIKLQNPTVSATDGLIIQVNELDNSVIYLCYSFAVVQNFFSKMQLLKFAAEVHCPSPSQ